jgi:cell division septation protein DedD
MDNPNLEPTPVQTPVEAPKPVTTTTVETPPTTTTVENPGTTTTVETPA